MPKIKMTIDLEIADGLFIKISAEGAVSIHKEEEAPLKNRAACEARPQAARNWRSFS